ncbi:MAG: NTP transferase domain-containing protein [Deltaproteobacteria bacterium]|nr:NTP transferase domain-containing protein [Deltaproteobacteria bacterium]
MGEAKALLAWGGRPLVVHQCEALRGFRDVVVVVGHDAAAIEAAAALPAGARWVENARWAEGRSTSLEAGARALPDDAAGVLVAAVDQPLDEAVVRALVAAYRPGEHAVVEPIRGGRRGHPVLLGVGAVTALRRAGEHDEGLRGIVRDARARGGVVVEVGGEELNLNTPAAYRAAREEET